MNNDAIRLSVIAAMSFAALAACSGEDDDGAGTSGTGGSSGGGAGVGVSGASGSSGGGSGTGGGAGASGRGGTGGSAGTGSGGNGGSAAGTGGSGSADDDAGTEPTAGEGGGGGNGAVDPRQAVATIAGFDGGSVTGTFTFTQDGADVTVVIALENCPDGAHQVHIHEGTSCDSEQSQGMHWGPTRGEGISDVQCSDGEGTVTHTRDPAPPETAWSIGGNPSSDIVGHAVVVHETGGTGRIGCGVITEL